MLVVKLVSTRVTPTDKFEKVNGLQLQGHWKLQDLKFETKETGKR